MSEDEIVVSVFLLIIAMVARSQIQSAGLSPLFFEKNPALGLTRLILPLSLIWTIFVIIYFGDPSITGVYIAFYLLMAYVATTLFGILGSQIFGVKLRDDVYERKNLAAAVFIGAFALATGLIFGASLWGEADPLSEDEGGWWIPVTFFILGWLVLVAALGLYLRREKYKFAVELRQNRNLAAAKAAGIFTLSTATVLVDGVAGDFFGWGHGLLTFMVVAGMLLIHEALLVSYESPESRWWETLLYPILALLAFFANRLLDLFYNVR